MNVGSHLGLIFDAAKFAEDAHKSQVRKVTGAPYILHPGRVASRVMLLDNTTHQAVAAAWLHDVVEDTGVTIQMIVGRFGPEVAEIVQALTNVFTTENYPAMNRAARKREEATRLSIQSRIVKQIKLLDRIDNLGEMDVLDDFTKTYLLESQALLEVCQGTDRDLEEELRDVMRKIAAVRQMARAGG